MHPKHHLPWLTAWALLSSGPAAAQVHKCTDAQGRTEYRAVPCADGQGGPMVPAAPPRPPKLREQHEMSPRELDLLHSCLDLHQKVDSARQGMEKRDASLARLTATSALNEAEIRESKLLDQADRLRIEEWQRQGNVAGCAKVQMAPGSASAETTLVAYRCKHLRESMQSWLVNGGNQAPNRAEVLAGMKEERRAQGCKD